MEEPKEVQFGGLPKQLKKASRKAKRKVRRMKRKGLIPDIKMSEGGDLTFAQAFAKARKEQGPGGTFEWNGKKYTTDRADDKKPADKNSSAQTESANTSEKSMEQKLDKITVAHEKGPRGEDRKAKGKRTRNERVASRVSSRTRFKVDKAKEKAAKKEARTADRTAKKEERKAKRGEKSMARIDKRVDRISARKERQNIRKTGRAIVREAKGKPAKKFLGGLAGAIGGARQAEGGLGQKLMGAAKGAVGGGMLGRAFGAAKGLVGGIQDGGGLKGALQGAAQGAAGGAFGNSNPMAGGQGAEEQQMMYGGMKDRRKKGGFGPGVRAANKRANKFGARAKNLDRELKRSTMRGTDSKGRGFNYYEDTEYNRKAKAGLHRNRRKANIAEATSEVRKARKRKRVNRQFEGKERRQEALKSAKQTRKTARQSFGTRRDARKGVKTGEGLNLGPTKNAQSLGYRVAPEEMKNYGKIKERGRAGFSGKAKVANAKRFNKGRGRRV